MKACGIIRGKVVELEESPGLPDGQRVEVELTPIVEDPVLVAATRITAVFVWMKRGFDWGATGSLLPVWCGCTGGQAASGTLPVGMNVAKVYSLKCKPL
jgi:hypothetical protein